MFSAAVNAETLITISSDGSQASYELATVQRIVFATDGAQSSMTVQRKNSASDITDVRCIIFGTTTELSESIGEVMLYIYPNPVQDMLQIHGIDVASPLSVYDLDGKCILNTIGNQVNVSHLPVGTYILRVNQTAIKFIKQK